LSRNTKLIEQTAEVGIRAPVVDDEAGVDGVLASSVIDHHGVAVAANPLVGLENHHLMAAA
jgi:hypothetical protein